MHFDVRDGGDRSLRTSRRIKGAVTVTDRTSGRIVDPALYVVQAQSVRRVRGPWGSGPRRWSIDYEPAEGADDAG